MTSLKILVVPSVIAFAFLFGVFWVYPEYQSMQTKTTALAEREGVLAQSRQMQSNGVTLLQDFKQNASQVDSVLAWIPRTAEEEKVLWILDQTARNFGVSLTSISVGTGMLSQESAAKTAEVAAITEDVKLGIADPSALAAAPTISVTQDALLLKDFSISFTVTGSYESFKNFLGAVQKIPRVYQLESVGIEKKTDTESKTETFALTGKISFPYAALRRIQAGKLSPVFEKTAFDFTPLTNAQSESTVYTSPETISSGRTNPFMP